LGDAADPPERRPMTAAAAQSGGANSLDLLRAVRAAAESGIFPAAEATPHDPGSPLAREEALTELLRIVSAAHAPAGVDLLCDTGLAARLLPEVDALRFMPALTVTGDEVDRMLALLESCLA